MSAFEPIGQGKPLASLSSGLLARKGGARPAMRRQLLGGEFEGVDIHEDDLGWNDMGHDEGPHLVQPHAGLTPMPGQEPHPVRQDAIPEFEEVGQDAMTEFEETSFEPEEAPTEAPIPAVLEERVVLARAVAEIPTPKAPTAQKAPRADSARADNERGAKAAFTLRVDPDRHLKLRLACAISNRSAQQIVTEALDNFLNQLPELAQLANQIPQAAGKRQLG